MFVCELCLQLSDLIICSIAPFHVGGHFYNGLHYLQAEIACSSSLTLTTLYMPNDSAGAVRRTDAIALPI